MIDRDHGDHQRRHLYYQNKDRAIPKELWVGADAYFRGLVADKPGLTKFWSEYQRSFDEPFRSYVDGEFAKVAAA